MLIVRNKQKRNFLNEIKNFSILQKSSYSKVPPLRNSLHKDNLIGFLCQDTLPEKRVCIPWHKTTFILKTAVKVFKKTFLKCGLLYEDLMV